MHRRGHNLEHTDLAVIGAGMAAVRLVETLRQRGDGRRVTVLGDERCLPYNRILLSSLLAGDSDWQQLPSHTAEWYRQRHVDLRIGQRVTDLNCRNRLLRCAGGLQVAYGQLVLATGSRSALPEIPGIRLPGVTGFRNVDDVGRLRQAAHRGKAAVVLGGGLLGVEAAAALARQGMAVSLVQRDAVLMNRQLDSAAAGCLADALAARGIRVIAGVAPDAVTGEGHADGVRLADGRWLPAVLVVAATGIRPAVELAAAAGLAVNRGIVVDRRLRTSVPDVYAVGECCEIDGETVGLVAPIWQQVEALAANLCGEPRRYCVEPFVTRLKVSGIDVHVMGEADSGASPCVTYHDRELGVYRKLVLREGRLAGALLLGDVTGSRHYFEMIERQAQADGDRCRLLLAGEPPAERLATA